MTNSVSALPAFSFNWVGGDIRGLSVLAQALYDFADKSGHPISVLSHTVDGLVSESGEPTYKGAAADNFKREFERDATDINWLSSRAKSMGSVVDGLAVQLAKLEASLENMAEQGVRAKYITMDSAGRIQIPAGIADSNAATFMRKLSENRKRVMAAAKAAREAAEGKLATEYGSLSGGLENYLKNHRNLLSDDELTSLGANLKGLNGGFAALGGQHGPPSDHEKSVMKDLVMGGATIIGGVAGGVIGTFAEPGGGTVAGIGLGGAAGQAVGSLLGSIFD